MNRFELEKAKGFVVAHFFKRQGFCSLMGYNLEELLEEVKLLKSMKYCGTQDAWIFLKEKRIIGTLTDKVNRDLKLYDVTVTPANVDQLLRTVLQMLTKLPYSESWQKSWVKENFVGFAKDYFLIAKRSKVDHIRSLTMASEDYPPLPANDVFWKFATLPVGNPKYSHTLTEKVNFDPQRMYSRLRNDHLLRRDEYQRMLIATFLDSYLRFDDARTFSGIAEFAISMRENSADDTEEQKAYWKDLVILLHRHKSFVEKYIE